MIDVVKLIKERGASRYGNCMNCGIGSHEIDDLMRIYVSSGGQGSSLVLCPKCLDELLEKIKEEAAE